MRRRNIATKILFLLFTLFSVSLSVLPDCTDNDLKGIYTYCENLNSTRSLYWYYPDTCNSTGLRTPNRVDDLPCDIECSSGKYLQYGATECSDCLSGTFSIGGGKRYIDFTNWPTDKSVVFNHYCSSGNSYIPPSTPICDGWILSDHYIESGHYTESNINSIIDIGFTLQKDGYVSFNYMSVSSNEASSLKVQVNFNTPYTLENTVDFTYRTINLVAGTYHVRWIYYIPDHSTPLDYARIDFIEVSGLSLAENECTKCPVGRYNPTIASSSCYKCPINYYANEIGSSHCIPCPENTYSILGSSSCSYSADVCDISSDATIFYGECQKVNDEWKRKKYYEWNVPIFCNKNNIDLPEPEYVECGPCPSNTIPDPDRYCKACNPGSYSDGSSCVEAKQGYAAVPKIYYNTWEKLPLTMSSYCLGDCSTTGWNLYQTYVGTPVVGEFVDLYLDLELTFLTFGGSISFDYFFSGISYYATFQFAIDGKIMSNFESSDSRQSSSEYPITDGYHKFTWYFHTDGSMHNPFARIYEIRVSGVVNGSADAAESCTPGYYQSKDGQSVCTRCPKGSYSDSYNAHNCSYCPENTYAEDEASSSCEPCPVGTSSSSDSAFCTNPDCIWYATEDKSVFYNLSPFSGQYQFVSNGESYFTGFYVVSYCGFVPKSTYGCTNSFICENFSLFNPINPTVSYLNWASSVGFEPMDNPYDGYTLQYRNGDSTNCPDKVSRSVDVIYSCEMEPSKFIPLTLDEDKSTECHLVMKIANYYGCPICSINDFTATEGDCEDGESTVTYTKHDNATCNGIMKDTTKDCGYISVTVGLLLVGSLLLFIFIVGLLVVLFVIYQKNKRLQFKYKQLQKTVSSSVEMEEQPSE